jgi:hypothetical protein
MATQTPRLVHRLNELPTGLLDGLRAEFGRRGRDIERRRVFWEIVDPNRPFSDTDVVYDGRPMRQLIWAAVLASDAVVVTSWHGGFSRHVDAVLMLKTKDGDRSWTAFWSTRAPWPLKDYAALMSALATPDATDGARFGGVN